MKGLNIPLENGRRAKEEGRKDNKKMSVDIGPMMKGAISSARCE